MSTGEMHPPSLHGHPHSRQQRHSGDDASQPFLPVSSSGSFLLPADPQGAFTFSAEPAMIDYSSMVSLTPSSGTAQDSVFTPNTNTGSSFDSSLHPEYLNHSYPPPNLLQAHQNYSLSPGTHSRSGQSISPSHSIDHLSPEAAYLSDPNHQDITCYTNQNFTGQYLEEPFSNLNFADPNITPNAFDTFPTSIGMSLPITPDALATYNAQVPQPLPANVQAGSQLISPCPTTDSSPVITQGIKRANGIGLQYIAQNKQQISTPPATVTSSTMHSTPSKQQQHSPALTNSSGSGVVNAQPLPPHLTSPIVRVEHYSRGESPTRSDISRPVSKRSHGSRRSANHLSPFPVDDSSSDEDEHQEPVRIQRVVRGPDRAEDGSWLPKGGSSSAGLSPDERHAMGDMLVPTLEEIAQRRKQEEKKLEVEDWLTKSEAASEAGDGGSSSNLLRPFAPRRRAKSTNDAHRQPYGLQGLHLGLGVRTDFDRPDDSGIPGPGLYVDERSEYDEYEDDEDEDGSVRPESPPAEIDVEASHNDTTPFPPLVDHGSLLGAIVRPWVDPPSQPPTTSTRYQPQTSNAAMMRFRLRAKDVETASLAATLGSRRLSESDLGSVRAAPGVVKVIQPDLKKHKERQRRPSFLENILPKRTPSNLLKRKGSIPVQQQSSDAGNDKSKEGGVMEKPKRMGSWGRPKSPKVDITAANQTKDLGPPSASNLSATSGPWYQGAKNVIRRSRSRSDLGKSPGLAELMTQHGGPPMPMLASPLAETEATKATPQPSPGGDEDEDETAEAITMDLSVRSDPIIPTYEGFKTHARQLNPRLVDYMVERITQEQMRRYKRLLEFKVKHLNAVKNRNCASGTFCTELGGSSKQLPPRAGNKDSDAPFIGFQITAPGSSDDDGDAPPEGTVVSAQFPSGVPLPPVKRLPAEFECPLCFKVKKFYKPSDWTKHVHEDVQPFTCTFPNCGEPKSFKRKADWVRHENERHRQLENWTCQIADCNHTCYRKDNFVQHLVREHKIAEPRARTGRTAAREAQSGIETEDIWTLVERCRRDTAKQPKDEPCRFCGNICNSWKKLTVHLAKHMEQISMPILPLVEQKQINADTIISPVIELPESRKLAGTPSKSPVDNPSRYNPKTNSTLAPGIDPSFGQIPINTSSSASASAVMHTYPPPQFMSVKNEQPAQKVGYSNYGMEASPMYTGQTYPGLQVPPKPTGGYLNGQSPVANQHFVNDGTQNGANTYNMAPIASMGQPQQAAYSSSPMDGKAFSTDTMGAMYFTQEPQSMIPTNGAMQSDMGMDTVNGVTYDASMYEGMSYMTAGQHNYQYQG
ncbi:uncharacterized protein EI97DRAFT_440685 [Westerdykella ornata]|uniref:C2H2-type domain-containing protein n=1 Tax=Westerdykella ornata TaxID=318751 RepID=A0A6A6JPJ6_WESOR|nr:uncharacterized protein EI97DRAFT_440685 [Westerdykella ornata]KAF2278175.1 hypothetical protein EI97DRAFT_440685 [Westerdykella ornata]